MSNNNGTLIKWGAVGAIVAVVVGLLSIFAFAGKTVDERIDVKILAHEKDTEALHQEQIGEIKQDIAVMTVQQQKIQEDIGEIKELIRDSR